MFVRLGKLASERMPRHTLLKSNTGLREQAVTRRAVLKVFLELGLPQPSPSRASGEPALEKALESETKASMGHRKLAQVTQWVRSKA